MTRTATGNVFHIPHVVLLQKHRTKVNLIRKALTIDHNGVRARRLPILHVEHLIARTQILLRRSMATQAPLHLQRLLLIHERHLVDWTVTGVATYAFIDMNAVIEIDEVRKLVHPRPLQRLAGTEAGANWLEQRRVGPDLRVAVHASLGRRNSGEAGSLDRSV